MTDPTAADWAASTSWYDQNPDLYAERADALDMSSLQDQFAAGIRPGGRILDYGCGSGRDLARFLDLGFDAYGIDGSSGLVELCRTRVGDPNRFRHIRFEDFDDPADSWDGIWAMASLLHLPRQELGPHLSRLAASLRPGGSIFACLKSGSSDFLDARGRPMSTLNEADAREILDQHLPSRLRWSVWSDISTDTLGQETGWTNIEIARD